MRGVAEIMESGHVPWRLEIINVHWLKGNIPKSNEHIPYNFCYVRVRGYPVQDISSVDCKQSFCDLLYQRIYGARHHNHTTTVRGVGKKVLVPQ